VHCVAGCLNPIMKYEDVREALKGPVASMRVPFEADGNIDYKGLRNAVEFDIAAGSPTILLTYGDSLYSVLTDAEVADVTKAVVEYTAKRAVVVAADRMWWTGKSVEFARYAREVGADILMTLPPDWGHSCTAQSFADHYAAVSAEMPVMIVTAAFAPRPASLCRQAIKLTLEQAPNVVAIKDDICGDLGRHLAILVSGRWVFFSGGQKSNHLDVWPYGCNSYLSTLITFKPEIAHRYWQAIEARDAQQAAQIIRDFDMPFFDYICGVNGGFDAAMHGIIELAGIAGRWRRAPYHTLNDQEMEALAAFTRQAGLL